MAVVDIGTNSTRLLLADVTPAGVVTVHERESTVTRLGEGVDENGRLSPGAMDRVLRTLERYRERIEARGVQATTAVLTSAVRDAANGAEFTALVRDRFGLDARTIDGGEEAALTFAGATSERPHDGTDLVVIDIGGGSTEFVAGRDGDVTFHVSVQCGVVRQTERHLRADPPPLEGLRALGEEVARTIADTVPEEVRERIEAAIAVAGTATSCAAIDLELDRYDRERVHGHVLALDTCERLLASLSRMTDDERREVVGLHPDRAPTIVAGVAILIESLRAFGLARVEVSEHDLLRGAALQVANLGPHGATERTDVR